MDFVLAILYIIQETCYLLSVTIEPSLIRMSLKKLYGTACDVSAIVTMGWNLLNKERQQKVKILITPKALVKDSTSNSYWITPSTETRSMEKRKRAKHAKTCEMLLLFVCGFFLILVDLQGVTAAVGSILVSATRCYLWGYACQSWQGSKERHCKVQLHLLALWVICLCLATKNSRFAMPLCKSPRDWRNNSELKWILR